MSPLVFKMPRVTSKRIYYILYNGEQDSDELGVNTDANIASTIFF